MDLQTLTFKVETKELANAVTELGKLSKAVEEVNKPLQGLSQASEVTSKATKKMKDSAEETEQTLSKVDKAIEKEGTRLKVLRQELIDTADGQVRLADSFTKGQAGQLAMLRLAGATTEQMQLLEKAFLDMNRIMGVNTFDKSAAGLSKLNKEFDELVLVNKLVADGIKLTKNEVVDLSRDLIRLEDRMRSETAKGDANEMYIQRQIMLYKQQFIEKAKLVEQERALAKESERVAKQEAEAKIAAQKEYEKVMKESLAAVEKEKKALAKADKSKEHAELQMQFMDQGYGVGASGRAATMLQQGVSKENVQVFLDKRKALDEATRAQREHGNAIRWVQSLEERLNAAIDENNQDLDRRSTDTLVKLRNQLRLTGMSAEQQEAKFHQLSAAISQVASKDKERDMRNLAKAMSVQLGDVGISLASGQNPFIVMIQQGDQIRDAISRSGVEAAQMGAVMGTALKQIVESAKLTAQAIGSFLFTSIRDTGKAVNTFAANLLGLGTVMQFVETRAQAMGVSLDSAMLRPFKAVIGFLSIVSGAFVALSAILGVSLLIALVKTTNQMDAMTRTIALNGGALASTSEGALTLASSLESVGVGASKGMEILTLMAKTGGFTASQFEMVATTAKQLDMVMGQSLEDTVKAFAEFKKDPVDALQKLAESTGKVKIETLLMVEEYKRQGNSVAAVTLAMREYERVNKQAVAQVREELSGLGATLLWIKETASGMWQGLKDLTVGIPKSAKLASEILSLEEKLNKEKSSSNIVDSARADGTEKLLNAKRAEYKALLDSEEAKRKEQETEQKAAAAFDRYNKLKLDGLSKEAKKLQELNQARIDARNMAKGDATKEARYFEDMKKGIEKKYEDKSAQRAQENSFETYMNKFTDLAIEAQGELLQLSKIEKEWLQIQNDAKFKKLSPQKKEELEYAYQEALAAEDLRRIELERYAVRDKANKAYADYIKKLDDEWLSIIDDQQRTSVALEEEAQLLDLKLSLLGQTSDEMKRQLGIQKAQAELQKELIRIRNLGSTIDTSLETERAYANYAKKVKAINAEIAADAAQKYVDEMRKVQQELTNIVIEFIENGSSAGVKKLKDLIKAKLREKITIEIDAVVNTIFQGTVDTLFGNGTAGSGARAFAQGSGIKDLSNNVGKLYDVYKQSGIGGIAGQQYISKTYGTDFGSQQTRMLAEQEAGMGGGYDKVAGTSMTAYAGMALAVAAAMKQSWNDVKEGWNREAAASLKKDMDDSFGGKLNIFSLGLRNAMELSRGLEKLGFSRNTADFLTAMPAFTKVFGRKAGVIQQQGFEGTFSGGDFTGNTFAQVYEKGGILRRSKTSQVRGEMSGADTQFFESLYRTVGNSIRGLAETLGIGTEAIDNFTYSFRLNLKDLSEEDQLKVITEEFNKLSDQMVANIIDIGEYRRIGETNTETLTRLSQTLSVTNMMFKDLGWSLNALSLSGYDAVESFAQLFGGVDQMAQVLGNYYQNFYTEQERAQIMTRNLTEEFAKLGVELPASKEALKAMIDQAKSAGDNELVAKLLSLSQGFAGLIEEQTKATEKYGDLQRRILELQGNTQALRELELSTLDETAKALQRQVWALEDAKKAQEEYAKFVEQYTSRGTKLREFVEGQQGGGQSFDYLMSLARSGDLSAIDKLQGAAEDQISLARGNARTLQEAEAEKQRILGTVLEFAKTLEQFSGSTMEQQVLAAQQGSIDATVANTASIDALNATLSNIVPSSLASGQSNEMARVVSALEALNARIELVEASSKASALANSKVVRILERLTPDGDTLQVNVV